MGKVALLASHGYTAVTGFSNQTWLLSRALVEDGWTVYVMHREYRGEPIEFTHSTKTKGGRELQGTIMLPWGQHPWGEDIFPVYISEYKPDIVFTLGDIWCYQFLKEVKKNLHFKWVAYYEFDTENIVNFWNDSIRNADAAVVPAKFAYDGLIKLKHDNVTYVPHAIDCETFKPCTQEEKIEFRKSLGLPEKAFVVGCVAHNQPRKHLYRLLHAFKIFLSDGKKDAYLVLHTVPTEQGGWDLITIAKDEGISERVLFTNKASKMYGDIHTPESDIRALYCAMDVHALPTGGEGFGVPLVESMACGIPTIATAYTTPPEFFCEYVNGKPVNVRGIAVPYSDLIAHQSNGRWATVNITLFANAMQQIYDNRDYGYEMGIRAREFVLENYNSEIVKSMWKELFNNVDAHSHKSEDNILSRLRVVRING